MQAKLTQDVGDYLSNQRPSPLYTNTQLVVSFHLHKAFRKARERPFRKLQLLTAVQFDLIIDWPGTQTDRTTYGQVWLLEAQRKHGQTSRHTIHHYSLETKGCRDVKDAIYTKPPGRFVFQLIASCLCQVGEWFISTVGKAGKTYFHSWLRLFASISGRWML